MRARPVERHRPSALTEIEVYRYLPAGPNVWPARLIEPGGLARQMLAAKEEPSFESLTLHALSMTPARAVMGFKDAPHDIGVTWDGTLSASDTLRFRFGKAGSRLADCRDTVQRRLIDGWRPGVVVEGQVGDLQVCQTALLAHAGNDPACPALFVRIVLKNLSPQPLPTSVDAEVSGRRRAETAV